VYQVFFNTRNEMHTLFSLVTKHCNIAALKPFFKMLEEGYKNLLVYGQYIRKSLKIMIIMNLQVKLWSFTPSEWSFDVKD